MEAREAAAKFLQLTEEECYQFIGKLSTQNGTLGAANRKSKDDEILDGRAWLTVHAESFQERICAEQSVRRTAQALTDVDEVQLSLSIGDLILGLTGKIPALCVSALIIKIGLYRYCNEIWKKDALD